MIELSFLFPCAGVVLLHLRGALALFKDEVRPGRFFVFRRKLMFAKGPICPIFCLGFLSSFKCPNVSQIGPHFCQARKVKSIVFAVLSTHTLFLYIDDDIPGKKGERALL